MFEISIQLKNFISKGSAPHQKNFQQSPSQIVTVRFGPIKFILELFPIDDGSMATSKKALLELSKDQLQALFRTMAFGLFVEGSLLHGNCFAVLSLDSLQTTEEIVDHDITFFDQIDQEAFVAELSLNFKEFRNPKIPQKKDKIENHKTFEQYFQKPSVPAHNAGKTKVQAKTFTDFVQKNATRPGQQYGITGGFGKPNRNNPKKKMTSTGKVASSKRRQQKDQEERLKMIKTDFMATQQYRQQFEDDEDTNPPVIDFVNNDQKKTKTLSKTLFEMNNTAPEHLKLTNIYQGVSKNMGSSAKVQRESSKKYDKAQVKHNFSKNKKQNVYHHQDITADSKVIQNKSQQRLSKVDREQLKIKAKQELESYKGEKCVQIPIFKDGRYELVDLNDLTEEEVANYAAIQKQKEQEERQKIQLNEKLKNKERQNENLRIKLEERENQLAKQQQEVKRLAIEKMMKEKRNGPFDTFTTNKSQTKAQKIEENIHQESDQSYNHQESQDYSSDFESASLGASELRSRLSNRSAKKRMSESESYNESYDPDFESYSQSLLGGSQKKISLSDISDSYKSISPKKNN